MTAALFMTKAEIKYNFEILQKNAHHVEKETLEEYKTIFSTQIDLLPVSEETNLLKAKIVTLFKPSSSHTGTTAKTANLVDPTLIIPAGMRHISILGDGHCMFRAIATGLNLAGLTETSGMGTDKQVWQLRGTACTENQEALDRQSPLPSTEQNDADLTTQARFKIEVTDQDRAGYFYRMRNKSTYGGELEARALAKHFNVQIDVVAYNPETCQNYTTTYNRKTERPVITLYYKNNHYELFVPIQS